MRSSLSAALSAMRSEALSAPRCVELQRYYPAELGAPAPSEMPNWREMLPDERARYALQLVRISNPPFQLDEESEAHDG